VNTRHKPARAPQIPSTLTLCTNSAHPYQNKGFLNQNSEFLSPLFSHCCALWRLQTLCFVIVHENWRGEGVTPPPTVPSRIETGSAPVPKRKRDPSRCSLLRRAGGMTAGKGKKTPRTGLPGEEPDAHTAEDRPLQNEQGGAAASAAAMSSALVSASFMVFRRERQSPDWRFKDH